MRNIHSHICLNFRILFLYLVFLHNIIMEASQSSNTNKTDPVQVLNTCRFILFFTTLFYIFSRIVPIDIWETNQTISLQNKIFYRLHSGARYICCAVYIGVMTGIGISRSDALETELKKLGINTNEYILFSTTFAWVLLILATKD